MSRTKHKDTHAEPQHSIPSAVRDEDAAFDFEGKERASDEGQETAKDEAAAQDSEMPLHPTGPPPAPVAGTEATPTPPSQTLENSETEQVEKMAAELERLRKLMAVRECEEIEEAKVPAPPNHRRVSDPVRQEEINRAMEAILADFPAPTEIVFDPKDVDAPVPTIKAFGEAAEKCSDYSYAFGGLAAVYHWRRGQCFVAIERILAPQGKWGEWYRGHGFDKSEVSRDRRLFVACPYGDKVLIGYSEAAAHRKFVAKRKTKDQPAPKSPAEKEAEARAGWLPCPIQGTTQDDKLQAADEKPCRHKIGLLTSVQVTNFLAYLRKFNSWLDALQFEITQESLNEINELLETVKKKLPKE